MPYIKKEDRHQFADDLESLSMNIESPGELNYVISMLCKKYIEYKKVSYSTYNEVVGVLECAKLEVYRHQVAPYEELKISENGEI